MESTGLRHRLQNGLTVLGEPNGNHVSSAVGFFVKTGARDEVTAESGVSHFLEHMMFKGTAKRNALEITNELGNLGAQANAFTSEETTVYYAVVTPDNFPAMQELLSDMLRPALEQEEFDTEKKVILEEIALYEDRPQHYLIERALRSYYGDHPCGNSVLGSHQSVSNIKRDQMEAYFRRQYSAANITLVATGNFSWEAFTDSAEHLCGSWNGQTVSRVAGTRSGKADSATFHKKNLSQAHLILLDEGVSAQDDDRYAMTVLSVILGDSSGSKLYWELIDSGIAEAAGTDNDERDGLGCFSLYACTEPSRIDDVSDRARAILAAAGSFTDTELERAKTKIASRVVLDGELPMGRLMALGLESMFRSKITPLRQVVDNVRRVTREDIERVLSRFSLKDPVEYRLLPES